MKKVLLVFGTRPEAIKMAPVVTELRRHPELFEVTVCVSGQHRQMLDQALEWFEIKADIDLALMTPGQDLCDITASVVSAVKGVLSEVRPDVLLVQGDTTTEMASSMAAFFARIDLGHIEAGLRTGNLSAPFPEEFNRRVTSIVAKYHFAPTSLACDNLLREHVDPKCIYLTGNTGIDALLYSVGKIRQRENVFRDLESFRDVDFGRKIVLITAHRRESFGEDFVAMCSAIKTLAGKYPELTFVYPVHLNPNVQSPVKSILTGIDNVKLIAPLTYDRFVFLMSRSYLILTDSGGIQEEAPSLGKPVLVMRNSTERPEGVTAGVVKLVGTGRDTIVNEASAILEDVDVYAAMSRGANPYGDGKASARIADILAGNPWRPFEHR